MLDLPREIWLHIANFISPSAWEGLIGLNSTFYHIGMESKYRQMSFAFLDNKMLRNLVRLKDPVVAKRVRVLHVYPGFLKQVLDRGRDTSPVRRSFRLRLTDLANQILDQKMPMGRNKCRVPPKFRTAEDIIQALVDVFGGLPNVTDYHIMWSGLQAIPESPVPFLTAVFRPSLRRVSLDISLENAASLLMPACHQCSIEELDLIIRLDHFGGPSNHILIMINCLAPAISRLHSTLRKLTIQAWEPLDLSPLFRTIHYLPMLEHLTLGIPIESPHLGDPSGVAGFLHRQRSTIRSFTLRATQYSGPGLTPDPTSIEDWVVRVLSKVHLKNLRELDISSSLFPFTASLACLRRFAGTITSLGLTGVYHEYPDVVAVLDAFRDRPVDQRLETLRLGSVTLTPELLDLLARELPDLYRLELLVREVAPHNDISLRPCKKERQIDYFFSEMEKRRYTQWHLRQFKILLTSFPYRFSYGPHMERLFARCVPTIQGFS